MGPVEQRATVAGVPMRWLERPGEEPAVVLVHGLPTSPALWSPVMARLAGPRMLAWEMVGYGASWAAARRRDVSVRAQAGHLGAWLDSMGLDRVVLAGHDLGAGVVQRLAVERRGQVAGIVLTDGIAYDNWPVWPMRLLRAAAPVTGRLPRQVLAVGFAFGVGLLHEDLRRGRAAAGRHWRTGYDHADGAAALVRQVKSLETADTADIAAELRGLRGIPSEVVWAGRDRFLPPEWGARLAADLDARLEVLPHAAHYTPEDHPEVLAAALTRVLRAAGE